MFNSKQYDLKNLGERVVFIEEGEHNTSSPTVVMLHGMFGGLGNFDAVIGPIARHFPVLVPAMPLYDMHTTASDIPSLAEWTIHFIRKKCEGKVVLMGNSLGGQIALYIALYAPELIDALILTGSSGLMENHLGKTFPRRADRDFIREKAQLTFYEYTLDEQAIDGLLSITTSYYKLLRLLRLARSAHAHNVEHELHRITCPVQLIWGNNDLITPPSVAQQFYDTLPNASLHWIDKCGHAPMMEHPQHFAELVLSFLHQLESQALSTKLPLN